MITKTFEIRDKGTFIPMLAVKLSPENDQDRYLLSRAGYGGSHVDQSRYVLLLSLVDGSGKYQCTHHEWNDRTRSTAHKYIEENFDLLESGKIIDVEYILGETEEPKLSERKG